MADAAELGVFGLRFHDSTCTKAARRLVGPVSSGLREAAYENCGEPGGPAFCPHCGQETEARRGPLLDVVNDVVSDWLSLDSRLLHSLRALLRPWHSSSLFLQGKRAPYLRPFRLYLLASLALFSSVLTLESRSADGLDIYIGGESAVTESFAPQIFGSESTTTVRRSIRFLSGQTLVDRWVRELAGDRIDRLRALPREESISMLFSGLRRSLRRFYGPSRRWTALKNFGASLHLRPAAQRRSRPVGVDRGLAGATA